MCFVEYVSCGVSHAKPDTLFDAIQATTIPKLSRISEYYEVIMTIEPCVRTLTTSPPVLISPKKNAGLSVNNWPSLSKLRVLKIRSLYQKAEKNCFSDAKKYVFMPANLVKGAIKGFCGHQGRKSSRAYAKRIPTVCGTGLMLYLERHK